MDSARCRCLSWDEESCQPSVVSCPLPDGELVAAGRAAGAVECGSASYRLGLRYPSPDGQLPPCPYRIKGGSFAAAVQVRRLTENSALPARVSLGKNGGQCVGRSALRLLACLDYNGDMLKTIHLENFKLHKETQIEAAPITVFIGPNNSGKSSIFQALLALRQAAARGSSEMFESVQNQPFAKGKAYLHPPGQTINIGGYEDVVRRGAEVIRLGMRGIIEEANPIHPSVPVEVSFAMDVRNNSLTLHKGQIKSHAEIKWLWSKALPDERVSITVDNSVLWFSAIPSFRLIVPSGFQTPAGMPVNEAGEKLREISESLAAIPARLLNSMHPVYPLRGFEEWGHPLPERKPDGLDFPALNERAVALSGLLAYDRDLEDRVSQAYGACEYQDQSEAR